MEGRAVAQQIPDRTGRPGLLIEGPIDDPGDPGSDDGSGAHRTGLKGHHEGRVLEPPTAERLGGGPQRDELGMADGIPIDLTAIVTAPDHPPGGIEDHGPDGNVVMRGGQDRLGEGEVHPGLLVQRAASS